VYDEVLSGYQPGQMADSPRELHHTQLPGKQQISNGVITTNTKLQKTFERTY
jgi:hypothetical protein